MRNHSIRKFQAAVPFLFACLAIAFFAAPTGEAMADPSESGTMGKNSAKVAEARPIPGVKGLDSSGVMRISAADRCPICAMQPVKSPKFSCAVQLKDETTYYFCGTGCMMRAWLHPEVFLKASRENIRAVVVRDYFSGEQFNGLEAVWIAGSDVVGPMGPALVPLKDENQLEPFKKRHGGKAVFHLRELDDDKWQAITGKKAIP